MWDVFAGIRTRNETPLFNANAIYENITFVPALRSDPVCAKNIMNYNVHKD